MTWPRLDILGGCLWKVRLYIQSCQNLGLCGLSFMHYSEKCFTQIALYGDTMLVPFQGAPTWRLYNNRNICHWVLSLEWKILTLEFWHIESDNSSSARTVHLAKTWAITPVLTYARGLSCCHFNVTQPTNLEIQMSSITKQRTLSSKTSSSYRLLYLMKLKL